MRAMLAIVILLSLALAPLGGAENPRPTYTTLVIDYVGKSDRPNFPIVISTSSKEGEWYKQHLFHEPIGDFAKLNIVGASTFNEITELPSLKRGLERATPTGEGPMTAPTVRFVAGAGHDYTQTTLDAQTSVKILLDIDKHVAKYPVLQSQIQEVENRINHSVRK